MDTDGNGSLSKEELESGLTTQGFEGEQAKCIVEELEYDSDGKYNIKEFLETVAFSDMFAKTYKFWLDSIYANIYYVHTTNALSC